MKNYTVNKYALLIVLLSAVAVFLAAFSIAAGASSIGLGDVIKWIFGRADGSAVTILRYARLPRTVGCILVGSALSVSGLLLQTALGNPLASPGVIGVNAGSGFFVVLAAALFPSVFWIKGAAAFLGALTAAMTVYAIAKKTGASRITIVLAGVAVSGMLTALIDAVTTLRPDSIMDKTEFYIGGFSSVQSESLKLALPVIFITIVFSQLFAGRLDLLLLGDEVAGSLGLNVGRCRFNRGDGGSASCRGRRQYCGTDRICRPHGAAYRASICGRRNKAGFAGNRAFGHYPHAFLRHTRASHFRPVRDTGGYITLARRSPVLPVPCADEKEAEV